MENEQTIELIKRAQNGDEVAASTLCVVNAPLVKSIIRHFRNRGVEYDDLFQIGSIGLIKAINNFSCDFNVRFSTYAVPMIIGEVKRFLRDDGYIKISRSTKSMAYKISYYIEEYKNKNAKSPSIDEIAAAFNIEPQEAVFAIDSARLPISLYEKLDEEGSQTLMDKIPSKSDDDRIDKLTLKNVIDTLSERDKKIVLMRYYRDKTQTEVARELNVSQVQVSRLENKIIKKLREHLE